MVKLRSERFLNRPLESVAQPISDITNKITEEQKNAANEAAPVTKEIILLDTPLEALNLPISVFNSLKRTGVTTVGGVLDLLEKDESAVIPIRNFGDKRFDELRQKMQEKGYCKDEGDP
jgi:DNA-directed RNA polymerase subunit alpha